MHRKGGHDGMATGRKGRPCGCCSGGVKQEGGCSCCCPVVAGDLLRGCMHLLLRLLVRALLSQFFSSC